MRGSGKRLHFRHTIHADPFVDSVVVIGDWPMETEVSYYLLEWKHPNNWRQMPDGTPCVQYNEIAQTLTFTVDNGSAIYHIYERNPEKRVARGRLIQMEIEPQMTEARGET